MQTVALVPDAVNLIDAGTHRVVARIRSARQAPFARGVGGIAFSPGSAWVMVGPKQSIVRIDLTTRRVTGVIGLPWVPGGIATGGGSVWVPQDFGSELVRIDARTSKISGRFDLGKRGGANTGGVAYGDGTLWLAQDRGVARLDPRTVRVVRHFHAPARLLGFADGAVWAATPGDGRVTKIDPVENRIAARTKLHGWLSDLAVGGGSVWISILPDGVVFRLSEDDLGVQSVLAAGTDPERISFGGGHLWIANTAARSVSLLDQVSGARQRLVATAGPTLAQYHDGLVWTSAAPAPAPLAPIAGEEIRVSTPTDTAVDPDPMGGKESVEQFMYAICSNLLNYPDSSGLQGARLRPEIAAAMPTVSPGGRTYTFHIRPGFPLLAALERGRDRRNVPAHTGAVSLAQEPVFGRPAPRLEHRRRRCLPRRQGRTHLGHRRPRQHALDHPGQACRGLPHPSFDVRLLPGSAFGADPRQRLHRAPHPFSRALLRCVAAGRSDSAAAEPELPRRPAPASRADRLYERHPDAEGGRLANAGALDLLPQDFDNTTSLLWPGGALDQRSGATSPAGRAGRQQYFLYAAPLVDYIVFNTRRPLFRDVRLRRAASYALDRRALAASFSDGPADQIVSPAVPGFLAGRVYPLQPDLATAHRLAGGRSRSGVLYFCGNPQERKVAQIVRSNLARIGISVSITESQDCPGRWQDADLLLQSGLQSEERDPMPFLDEALSSGIFDSPLGPGPWNDPTFRKQLEEARPLRGAARIAAYGRLVDELMRMAPFAGYGTYVGRSTSRPRSAAKSFWASTGSSTWARSARRADEPGIDVADRERSIAPR